MNEAIYNLENTENSFANKLNLKAVTGKKRNIQFIDFIRFISMIGIVSFHSTFLSKGASITTFLQTAEYPSIFIAFISLLRFSVISFCMITGYLIANKIQHQHLGQFYKQRMATMLKPYIFAFLLTALALIIKDMMMGESRNLFAVFFQIITTTAFWFIPSSLLALAGLLLVIKRMPQKFLGLLLFGLLSFVTIKYVYIEKYDHLHPVFALAFVFYLWLGYTLSANNFVERIRQWNMKLVLIVWVCAFVIMHIETLYLQHLNFPSLLNNMRASIQLYALSSFVLLVKLSDHFAKFKIVNPRTETYGIYLYHTVVGSIMFFVFRNLIGQSEIGTWMAMLYTTLHFAFTYIISTIIAKSLLKWKLGFLQKDDQLLMAARMRWSFKTS